MGRKRRSYPAIGALGLTLVGYLGLWGFLSSIVKPGWGDPAFGFLFGGALLAAGGIVLGYLARRRIKRSGGTLGGTILAFSAVILGYGWFVIVCFLDMPYLIRELLVIVGLIELPRLFAFEAPRRVWTALIPSAVLAGMVWFLIESSIETHWVLAAVGVLEMCFLPGWLLFQHSQRLTPLRKIVVVLFVYLLAAGDLWWAWRRYNLVVSERRRPKRSQAVSQIRNLAVNLETYYIDHNLYPPAVAETGRMVPFAPDGSTVSSGYVPWMLTTPIAYTAMLPEDRFHPKPDGSFSTYRYATNGTACWIMTSNGPDGDADIKVEEYPVPSKGNCSWKTFMSQFGVGNAIEFDASNGAMSSGDVVRVGP
jgi:hypothetical protein